MALPAAAAREATVSTIDPTVEITELIAWLID
jgi:hypothetical protein